VALTARVCLGLGSNLGDRYGYLIDAIDRLGAQVKLEAIASIYETEPWGYVDQSPFLNTACFGTTTSTPDQLLAFVKSIETAMGRGISCRYGPRVIDIDVLLIEDQIADTDSVRVPHAGLAERAFVLVPLAEIAPQVIHPELHQPIETLRDRVDASGVRIVARRPLLVGSRWLHWDRQTYIMGIINATPDSFSGDGMLAEKDRIAASIERALEMVQSGAHLIDVGGESTRPGARSISIDAEIDRVLPVIEALTQHGLGPISIDTFKAEVARQALDAGAAMINDVWGLRRDPDMAGLAAKRGVPIVLMHNRSQPEDAEWQAQLGPRYTGSRYDDLIPDIRRELCECVASARAAGIQDHAIIIDPGIGFGKTTDQNLELLNRLDEFAALGYPILSGPSRKSFIGYTLNAPPDQRSAGTAAAVAISIARGADIVRVHDLPAMAQVAKMTDAIVRRHV